MPGSPDATDGYYNISTGTFLDRATVITRLRASGLLDEKKVARHKKYKIVPYLFIIALMSIPTILWAYSDMPPLPLLVITIAILFLIHQARVHTRKTLYFYNFGEKTIGQATHKTRINFFPSVWYVSYQFDYNGINYQGSYEDSRWKVPQETLTVLFLKEDPKQNTAFNERMAKAFLLKKGASLV